MTVITNIISVCSVWFVLHELFGFSSCASVVSVLVIALVGFFAGDLVLFVCVSISGVVRAVVVL